MVTVTEAPNPSLYLMLVLIVLLACAAVGLLVYVFGHRAYDLTAPYTNSAKDKLDRAGIAIRTEQVAVWILAGTALTWAAIIVFIKPELWIAAVSLPLLLVVSIKGVEKWVDLKISRRRGAFINQLELVLRLISSGVRAGLGVRQALVLVTQEMPDPAKYEFNLVLMQTNVGVGVNDALARMAQRMPSQEVEMLSRTIAMQSTTGGNLAKTLDNLSNTIKERRRIFRKVRAITAEARGSAYILGSLPLICFGMMLALMPDFREPTFGTTIGRIGLAIGLGLEALGGFVLYRLTLFKV